MSQHDVTDALLRYLEAHGFENTHVTIGRNGHNITASCPFAEKTHKSGTDKHPSWGILVETGQWSCFACKAKGNLQTLANELGIPYFDIGKGVVLTLEESFARLHQELSRDGKWDTTPPIMNLPDTFGFFDFQSENKALDWLTSIKGFSIETLKAFGVGYNRNNENPIFPITDDAGNIVGWQERNRRYPKSQPKYLFSHNLEKTNILYNYHKARSADYCVIVEAVMSVLAFHEVGISAVSSFNADLSKVQAAKLGVFKKVILCFDNDVAGQVALQKTAFGTTKGKKYTPPLLQGAPFEIYYILPPTKIHRMSVTDRLSLLNEKKPVKRSHLA